MAKPLVSREEGTPVGVCEYLLRRHVDQCRRAAQCGAPNYARGDSDFKDVLTLWRGRTRTTWMPQQDGDEGHGGEGRGTSGERGADDDAAAAVAALALHAHPEALIVSDATPGLASSLSRLPLGRSRSRLR